MQLDFEQILSQAKGIPNIGGMLAQAQTMMAAASCAAGAEAKFKQCASPTEAVVMMNKLFKQGHIPTGAPVPHGGGFLVFYWHKQEDKGGAKA